MVQAHEKIRSLGDYVDVLRRRWPILVGIIPSTILAAVFLAYVLPAKYQSTATILLESSSISKDLVRTTVVSYADQQIELVRRKVMTVELVESVVSAVDPYPKQTQLSARDKARLVIENTSIQKVDPITFEPLPQSDAFSIFYINEDPELAQEATRHIANLFLEYNRETRIAQAKEAYDFLLVKSRELDTEIREKEQKIAEFKTRYGDALPEARNRNEASLDRVQRDVDTLEAQIRVVAQQEALLKLQLGQISPTIVASGTDAYTQLGQLRAELAAAQQKYTPDHPDVKRLTRAIEAMSVQANLGNAPGVRPDNPDYLRVSSDLGSVQQNLNALRANASRARQQLLDYERRLTQAPSVERDYAQIVREHELAQTQFGEIQTKLHEAEIAQSLESESRGERFTLIRAPQAAEKPYFPNRLGVILLGIVLGFGVAGTLAAFRESSDPTVRNLHDLQDAGNVALIGAIPSLRNGLERRQHRFLWTSIAGGYAVAVAVVAITVLRSVHG